MPEKVKKCPFCGGYSEIRTYREDMNFVQCKECLSATTNYLTTEGAVQAWNNRYNLHTMLKNAAKYYMRRFIG